MRLEETTLHLAATDLANHLGCRHLTNLNHRVAHGTLDKPKFVDPVLEILAERGQNHETAYLTHLRNQNHTIAELTEDNPSATAKTTTAMRNGTDVIFQASLQNGCWQGRADFLIRTN